MDRIVLSGDKDQIAIEWNWNRQPPIRSMDDACDAEVRLWIRGRSYGDSDEGALVGVAVDALDELCRKRSSKDTYSAFSGQSDEDIARFIGQHLNNDCHRLELGFIESAFSLSAALSYALSDEIALWFYDPTLDCDRVVVVSKRYDGQSQLLAAGSWPEGTVDTVVRNFRGGLKNSLHMTLLAEIKLGRIAQRD